jgi:hypothetical protein
MFSDNQIAAYSALFANSSVYVDGILANPSLVDRYTSTKYCANLNQTTVSLLTQILKNADYEANSFESKRSYFSCKQMLELFCNPSVTDKFFATHTIFDCLDYLEPAGSVSAAFLPDVVPSGGVSAYPNATKIVTLAPSTFQLSTVLSSFLARYSIYSYAIVYSTSANSNKKYDMLYYQQLASNLAYKLSIGSAFSLSFSYSLDDTDTIRRALDTQKINRKF